MAAPPRWGGCPEPWPASPVLARQPPCVRIFPSQLEGVAGETGWMVRDCPQAVLTATHESGPGMMVICVPSCSVLLETGSCPVTLPKFSFLPSPSLWPVAAIPHCACFLSLAFSKSAPLSAVEPHASNTERILPLPLGGQLAVASVSQSPDKRPVMGPGTPLYSTLEPVLVIRRTPAPHHAWPACTEQSSK